MAKAGDEIFNPRTGQRMVFQETGKETGGQSVRIDTYNLPTGVPEPEHVHPSQESGLEMVPLNTRRQYSPIVFSFSSAECSRKSLCTPARWVG